jgi:hypothetical protein
MFWIKIKGMVYVSILYVIETGEMFLDQRRGVLTLSPPKGIYITSLKHWRPVSFLNSDYKILEKLFANCKM